MQRAGSGKRQVQTAGNFFAGRKCRETPKVWGAEKIERLKKYDAGKNEITN